MQKKICGAIAWLEFSLLQPFPEVKHAVFLRGQDFDLGDRGKVADQLRALRVLGVKQGVKIVPQAHGDRVFVVDKPKELLAAKKDGDALITRCRGVGLVVRHADCQGAIFYDPRQRALAVVHCGWRGSVKNIYQNTLVTMEQEFGTKARDVRVCVGPSLGPKRAEFKHYRKELPRSFWRCQIAPGYFDFWQISQSQLEAAGVLTHHIEMAKICTYSSPQECFSYRRDPQHPGRHATMAALE